MDLLSTFALISAQAALLSAAPRAQRGDDHAVIVHADSTIESLSGPDLRRLMTGGQQFWSPGRRVELFLPRSGSPSKEALLERVYHMNDQRLKRHWMQLICQNKISRVPRTLPTAAAALRAVGQRTAGIAVVPASESSRAVNVVAVNDALPGEPGYGLWSRRPLPIVGALRETAGPKEASASRRESDGAIDVERIAREVQRLHAEGGSLPSSSWFDASGWPPVSFVGFAHSKFEHDRRRTTGSAVGENGFSVETLNVIATSQFDEAFSALAETVVLGTGENENSVALSRLLLKYSHSDEFTVQAGRFLTGIGQWNDMYQYCKWLQTSIDRPQILDFEERSALLPIHGVGLSFQGTFHGDRGALDYTVELTNGRGPTDSTVQFESDANTVKAVNLRLGVEPAAVPGLRFGGGVYVDKIPGNQDSVAGPVHGEIDESIYSAFLQYDHQAWQILAEYMGVEHDEGTGSASSSGWYAQVARRLGNWTPYVRIDNVRRDDQDRYFEELGDGRNWALGLRYDVSRSAALTLQYEDFRYDPPPGSGDEDSKSLVLQASFVF